MRIRGGLVFLALFVGVFASANVDAQCLAMCQGLFPGCNVVSCGGGPCIGTPGADCFDGSDISDIIFGFGGDDCICGGDGNDNIQAGPGADWIFGGDGTDNIFGEDGADFIFGGDEADTVSGGPGADQIFGEAGNDTLNGDGDGDSIFGGDGDDTINGGDGDDLQLFGEAGEDEINGGPGNDIADGGDERDTINGNDGADTLSGGAGPDLISGNAGDDTLNGNADNDTLDGGPDFDTANGGAGLDVCLAEVTSLDCDLLSHATVSSFDAFVSNGDVIVRWITSSESSTIGFYLYRERDGDRIPVHEGLLPGLLSSPQGGVYELRDEDAAVGQTTRYVLVEVDALGLHNERGPFEVTPRAAEQSILSEGEAFARKPFATASYARKAGEGSQVFQRAGSATAVYVGIEEDGLYAVPVTEIASILGLSASIVQTELARGGLSVTESGQSVSWMPSDDGTELRFIGFGIDSLFTRHRLYRISIETGVEMSSMSAAPGGASAGSIFTERVHLEEDNVALVVIAADPDSDYWFWQLVAASPAMPTEAQVTASLEHVVASGAPKLTVGLHGVVDAPHSATVFVNGARVGTTEFEGVVAHLAEFDLPVGLLLDGSNDIRITSEGNESSQFFLDALDIEFERTYQASSSSSLAFVAPSDGAVTVLDVDADQPRLFDISDPRQPKVLDSFTTGGSDVSLEVVADRRYLVADGAAAKPPPLSWGDVASNLRGITDGASFVVIAPAIFYDQAQRLVDYRASQGQSAMLVELQDVFDEFAHGVPTPNAIQDFMRHALEHWVSAPEYLVLVGKGSFDYRDLQGAGDNYTPPLMAPTPSGLFASDGRCATISGAVPEFMVGRLPVVSNDQLDSIITQIIDYEASPDLSDHALLVADAIDPQSNFESASEQVASAVGDRWSIARAYRGDVALETFRDTLFDSIEAAPRIVHYLGHAGIQSLGKNESFLSVDDVAGLGLDGAQPVYALMTCSTSRFAVPGLVSLGEELLLSEEGAVAVWGPTGLSITAQAQQMGQVFLDELGAARERGQEARLGDLVLDAYQHLIDKGGDDFMPVVYGVLGDPALRVSKGAGPSMPDGGLSDPDAGAGGSPGGGDGSEDLTLAGCAAMSTSTPRGGVVGVVFMSLILLTALRRRRRH